MQTGQIEKISNLIQEVVVTVYEVKDSYFFIFDAPFVYAVGLVVGLIVGGIIYFKAKKGKRHNQ